MSGSEGFLCEECFQYLQKGRFESNEDVTRPEDFVLSVCFPNNPGYSDYQKPYSYRCLDGKDYYAIYDGFGSLIVKGKINVHGLQELVCTYCDGELRMKAHYKDNKKDGLCSIYKNRMLVFEGRYSKGVPDGVASEYDANKKKMVLVQYDNGHQDYSRVEFRNSFYVEKKSKDKISCYGVISENGSSRFEDEGYCFDQTKRDKDVFVFIHKDYDTNKKSEKVYREMNDGKMCVYSYIPFLSNGEKKYKEVCCYEGEYTPSFVDGYPRCGEGYELFTKQSSLDDKEVVAKLYGSFDGDKCDDTYQILDKDCVYCICNCFVPESGVKQMTMFDEAGGVIYNGSFDDWQRKKHLNSLNNQTLLNLSFREVSDLIVDEGAGLGVKTVDFSHLLFLRSIEISDKCFPDATTVIFFHLPFLKTIKIGNGCFTRSLQADYNHEILSLLPEETEYQGVLTIHSCSSLTEVTVGDNCFMEYSVLCIENNPSLSSLQLGVNRREETRSLSFYNVNEFRLERSSSLTELVIGNCAFMNASSFVLRDCSKLDAVRIGFHSFFSCEKAAFVSTRFIVFSLTDLPSLRILELQDCFISCKFAYFIHTPNVDNIYSRYDQMFSSLVTLHTLNASQCIDRLAKKNPIESPIVKHTYPFFFDPFKCIHFDIETVHVDCYDEQHGEYSWDGGVKGDDNQLTPNGVGSLKYYDSGDELKTSIVDSKLHGWTVTKYDDEKLKEECCYKDGKKHGMVTEYLKNGDKKYSSYYQGKDSPSVFEFDVSNKQQREVVKIDSEGVDKYCKRTESKHLHPIVFSKDIILLQCCSCSDDFLLVGAVLEELRIGESNGDAYHSIVLSQLPRLNKLVVKQNALSKNDANGVFQIEYCKELKTISIERNACSYYSSFLLKDLPKLSELKIGEVLSTNERDQTNSECKCFSNAKALNIPSLPSLSKLQLGDYAFRNVESFRLGCCNSLKSVVMGKNAMEFCRTADWNYCSDIELKKEETALCQLIYPTKGKIRVGCLLEFMRFVTGQAVIESSLCVIGSISIQLAISTCNNALCILLRRKGSTSTFCIHYHRICFLSIYNKLISTFLHLRFYSKYDTKIKMDIQLSHNEGGLIASSLYEYFRVIQEGISSFVAENRIDVHSALKQHNEMNSNRWLYIQETRSLRLTPTKTPPSTNYSLFLHSQSLSSPSKSDDTQSPVKKSCLIERSFPTQQQAIDFIDHYRSYSRDIKLFSYERLSDKRRMFAALNQDEFQWEYVVNPVTTNPLQHAYEIIREGFPCKLYMDVEYLYQYNPGVVGVQILNLLLRFVSYCVFYQYGEIVTPGDYSCIFSENTEKFSCHVILNKKNLHFQNNIHLGRFMEWAVNSLKHSPGSEYSSLFVRTKDGETFVADMAVYTKNRAMRLLKSSKHSQDKSKKPFNTFFSLDEWQLFLPYTLVTEYSFYKKPIHLVCMKSGSSLPSTSQKQIHNRKIPLRTDSFPYPSLPNHILSNWEFVSHVKGGFIRNWCYWEGKFGGWKVRFDIGGNRYCLNKGREHKSNHIYFIVDLSRSCFYQRCHDSECGSFLSSLFPIPVQETEPVIEYFNAEKVISTL